MEESIGLLPQNNEKGLRGEWDPLAVQKRIDDLLNKLEPHYSFREVADFSHGVFDHYDLLANYREKGYLKTVGISEYGRPSFYVMFVHAFYTFFVGARYGNQSLPGDDLQVYGTIKLKNDYGDVLIRPETLEDKIHELIEHEEIRFPDHPHFSRHYYVLAKDVQKFTSIISDDFILLVSKLRKAYLEIHGYRLLVGFKKNADEESLLSLTSFLAGIAAKYDAI